MPSELPPGPYRVIRGAEGSDVPFYVVPFDKRGRCQGPETRRHLLEHVGEDRISDVFLFSHGWNNDWTVAINRYEHFISGYVRMRRERALPVAEGWKPLLVGIFWPSTALVFTDEERGPDIASGQPQAVDLAVAEERREVSELAEDLDDEQAADLYRLSQKDRLSEAEALRLAEIATVFYGADDDELGIASRPEPREILEIWRRSPAEVDDLAEFIAGGGGPQAAGFLDALDPRRIVRTLTVFKMKDRAGRVGATGVHELLRDLLARTEELRVHAVGHSYGAKVMLSAICAGELPRPLRSLLLLQPAVSHLCFADQVPTTERPGGYRAALRRVENPILTTFSRHDFPLGRIFHLAVRREADLGEARIAAAGEPPSKYAALGGYGPRKSGERLLDVLDPLQRYPLDGPHRVFGVHATRTIGGHGDVSNESTWWALHNLVSHTET